jgi:hypothetical protein
MAEPLRPLGRPAAQVIIIRLTNHSLRSRYDRIAGRMNTDAWPGWLVVQPEGTECGALAVPTRTVPVSGKFGPVEFHVPRRLVSKASFSAHRSNEYRAARKRRRFQDGDGVDFSTLILRPKLGCCGRSMRYCWSIRWRKTGNRWRVPHLICRCVTLSVTKMALDCSRDWQVGYEYRDTDRDALQVS